MFRIELLILIVGVLIGAALLIIGFLTFKLNILTKIGTYSFLLGFEVVDVLFI